MRLCVLMGSPRRKGNTAAMVNEFLNQWAMLGGESRVIWLYDRQIHACLGCMACQDCMDCLGCIQQDDVADIFGEMARADGILLATPIYAWYCTPPMKALVDRVVYAGNKKYGAQKGPALLEGKYVATLTTCGYPADRGADLWEEGLKRLCRHSKMHYLGTLCRRDLGREIPFMDEEAARDAGAFARSLLRMMEVKEP